jgi:hypothetical protein
MRILIFLYFLIFTGMVAAQFPEPSDNAALAQYYHNGQFYPYYFIENNTSLEFDQKVHGNGFFSSDRFAYMPNLAGNLNEVVGYGISGDQIQHRSHGSGTINNEYKLSGYSYNYQDNELVEDSGDWDEVNQTNYAFIQTIENVDMTYSPVVMSVGNRHYSDYPIHFDSLLAESMGVKNLDSGTLMQNKIDYARGLHKELEASTHSSDYTDDKMTNTSMKLNEAVTEGTARISVLQLAEVPNFNDTEEQTGLIIKKSKPDMEVDEIYQGTFNILKNMSISVFSDDDKWLLAVLCG